MMARNKKRWRDLTIAQRIRIASIGTVQLALLATALADIRRRPASAINGRKWQWTAVAFVNGIGPVAYFLFGRKRDQAHGRQPGVRRYGIRGIKKQRSRPVAPATTGRAA